MPRGGGSLSGTVFDSLTTAPLEYATITFTYQQNPNLVTGSISKKDGAFKTEKIPYGKWDMKCTFFGYETFVVKDIEISRSNKNVELGNIMLSPAAIETEKVSLTAEKEYVTYSIDKKVVNVSKNLDAQTGTAVDALKNVPSFRTDIEGNVSLRGSQNFTILVDGRPTVMNGQDLLKQIPAASLDDIEIITNPSAKYDPEGTAGIINLLMRKDDFCMVAHITVLI